MSEKGVKFIFSLYRQLLRLHRSILPPPMRRLGDQYIKAEFQLHLSPKTTEAQWREFVKQWQEYADVLVGQASSRSGELPPEVVASLSAEQRKKLDELKEYAQQLAGSFSSEARLANQ